MAKIVPQKHGGSLKIPEKGETANPKGRPKKGISLINQKLKEKGYEPAKKHEIDEIYLQLVNLPEDQLKKLLSDKKQPMLVRIVIKNMLDNKRGFDIIEKILDRSLGKPTQSVDAVVNTEIAVNTSALNALENLLGNTTHSEMETSENS